jgi:hypothetical protein
MHTRVGHVAAVVPLHDALIEVVDRAGSSDGIDALAKSLRSSVAGVALPKLISVQLISALLATLESSCMQTMEQERVHNVGTCV